MGEYGREEKAETRLDMNFSTLSLGNTPLDAVLSKQLVSRQHQLCLRTEKEDRQRKKRPTYSVKDRNNGGRGGRSEEKVKRGMWF